jgi:hypothetical protein
MERTMFPATSRGYFGDSDKNCTFFLLLHHKQVSKLKSIITGRDLTKVLGASKEVKMDLGAE